MGGIIESLAGTHPEQQGTAIDPNQQWMSQTLRNYLTAGAPLYHVPQAPTPYQPTNFNEAGYNVSQAPFTSASDFLDRGEVNTAKNTFADLVSQFGSSRGGIPGGVYGSGERMASDLAQGAVGRYTQANLPYAEMQTQANMDLWNRQYQNQTLLPLQQANMYYQMGQIPQWQQQAGAYQAPWNLMASTYGSPIVGTRGAATSLFYGGGGNGSPYGSPYTGNGKFGGIFG